MAANNQFDGIRVRRVSASAPIFNAENVPNRKTRRQYVIRISDLFLYVFLSVCVYVLIAPLTPLVTYGMSALSPQLPDPVYLVQSGGVQRVAQLGAAATPAPVAVLASVNTATQPSHLSISKIGVDADIVEGATEDALNQGVWRVPFSSTPDKGGNTVLAAHRFMYLSGPKTFFNLDKLAVGDQFSIRWNTINYSYMVASTQVVTSDATWIEAPTTDPIVTLFTCTPLWTSKNRLVVRAKLVNN